MIHLTHMIKTKSSSCQLSNSICLEMKCGPGAPWWLNGYSARHMTKRFMVQRKAKVPTFRHN